MADTSIIAMMLETGKLCFAGLIGVWGKTWYDQKFVQKDRRDAASISLQQAELTDQARFQKDLMEMFKTLQSQNQEQQKEINQLNHMNNECEKKTNSLILQVQHLQKTMGSMIDIPTISLSEAVIVQQTQDF